MKTRKIYYRQISFEFDFPTKNGDESKPVKGRFVVTDLSGEKHYFNTPEYEVSSYPDHIIVVKNQ